MSRRSILTGAAVLVVAAACGGESVSSPGSTTVDPVSSSTVSVTTSPAPTSPVTASPVTTSPAPTSPATTSPVTVSSVAPSSVPPTTIPGPDVTSPPLVEVVADGAAPATAITLDGFDLVERDVSSGDVIATLVTGASAEATFLGHFALTPERDRLYLGRTFEDFWFSCESSVGEVLSIDLATGAIEFVGPGWAPTLDADATRLAYLASSQCLPDPELPEDWVVTPSDRVVVVDLASGERIEYAVADPPGATDPDPNALAWVGFDGAGALLVQTTTGVVHRLGPDHADDIRSAPVVEETPDATPVGVVAGHLIMMVTGDEGSVDLYARDLESGEQALLVMSEYPIEVAQARSGHLLVAYDPATAPPVVVAGPFELLPIPDLTSSVAW